MNACRVFDPLQREFGGRRVVEIYFLDKFPIDAPYYDIFDQTFLPIPDKLDRSISLRRDLISQSLRHCPFCCSDKIALLRPKELTVQIKTGRDVIALQLNQAHAVQLKALH
jgi:hypothetical protein